MSLLTEGVRALFGSGTVSPVLRFLQVLAVFAAAIVVNRLVQREFDHPHANVLPAPVRSRAGTLARFVIFGVALVVALSITELPVGQLLASLGVVAVLTAFLANQFISNVIAGVILVIDSPFAVGDELEMGGLPASVTGPYRVRYVGLRTTRLAGAEGREVIVPNQWFLVNPFANLTSRAAGGIGGSTARGVGARGARAER